jgi:RHS repeat-associated protein
MLQNRIYRGEIVHTTGGTIDAEIHRSNVATGVGTAAVRLHHAVGGSPAGVTDGWFQLTDLTESAVIELHDDGQIIHFEEYAPFGGTVVASGGTGAADVNLKTRRYSGHERDAGSGLYYYGLRYYACWLGRWISPDPALDFDGLNLYRFVQNNPVLHVDWLGLGKLKPKTLSSKTIKGVEHRHHDVFSSKFRFFRRIQRAYGGSRNIAMLKLVKGGGKNREVLYVLSRSMGLGVSKLRLRNERITVKSGAKKMRSHSEAVLRAALEIDKVKLGKKVILLSKYKVEHAASTNEACGQEHENCANESVPSLGGPFFFSNKYKGSGDSGGFEKQSNAHERNVKKGGGYESEDESEDAG